jgi:hypothetical protein
LPPLKKKLAERVRRGATLMVRRFSRLRKNFIASPGLGRARLNRLRKNSDSPRFWEGHDFSRAVKSLKMVCALAPEVCFVRLRPLFQQPFQSCRNYCRNIAGFTRRGLVRTVDLLRPQPSKSQPKGIAGSALSFGRAAMIFAAVVVVAIVLGWAISRGAAASIKDSQTEPAKPTAAPEVNSLTNPEPQPAAAAVTVPPPASKFEAKPAPRSRGIEADMVAHDTVTYFNKPAPAKGFLAPSREFARGK